MSTLKAGKIQTGISVTPGNNFVLDASADDGTLVLRDSAGTALLTLASGGAADLYAQGNILGTVSQSGGVPTGAIIERGSNASGEYTKFADGTLICAAEIPGVAFVANASSSVIWTFPAVFVGRCVPSVSSRSSAPYLYNASCGTPSTTSITVYTGGAASGTITTTCIAKGRWF